MREDVPISLPEALGLTPLGDAVGALRSVAGFQRGAPANLWGPSSLRIFKPWISLPTWLGRTRSDGLLPLYNFFNRTPQPSSEGYSVRVDRCRDVAGGQYTYDGHLGTDFACPVGTPIVAAAPGIVVRVGCELDRGGLKVVVDHGGGLIVTYNHLARAEVAVGQPVRRGERLARSGASGLEFALFFPWVSPHLHWNTWVGGVPADPFAAPGEVSLFRHGNAPKPAQPGDEVDDADFVASAWCERGVRDGIALCRNAALRAAMEAKPTLAERGAELLVQRNYRSPLFEASPSPFLDAAPRRAVLDLPFAADRWRGVWLPRHARSIEGGH